MLGCAGSSLLPGLLPTVLLGFSCCRAQALGRVSFDSCGYRALEQRLHNCGAQAQLFLGMWDLSGSGMEPASPALAGGFLTTEPPGKLCASFLKK